MRTWVLGVCTAMLGVACVLALRLPWGEQTILVGSNIGQLAAAVAGSVGCAIAARRTSGHRRSAWVWLSVGTAAWAGGQAVWSHYEVVLGRDVPSPSPADIGFLLFPLLSAVGLVTWLGTQDQFAARGRDLFDGVIIAWSLLLLSWITTLRTVIEGREGAAVLVELAYPVGDVVLGTLVLIALVRGHARERGTLALLAIGLGGLAFADSAYLYLESTGAYTAASVASSGWMVGFLFVGAAGLSAGRTAAEVETAQRRRAGSPLVGPRSSLVMLGLPYVPLAASGVALTAHLATSPAHPAVELGMGAVLIGIVLARQFLAMVENQRLVVDLAQARDQLAHRTLHDDLTGLANRVLFADRLDRALMASDGQVSVMFCDLDDFKLVNDELGHDIGDAFLVEIAARLGASVRITDTVARLGGDEFAVLLEGDDPQQAAQRIIAAVGACREVRGHPVRASVSVGIATHRLGLRVEQQIGRRAEVSAPVRTDRGDTGRGSALDAHRAELAARLLRAADTAMYAAKGAGKGRAMVADQPAGDVLTVSSAAS